MAFVLTISTGFEVAICLDKYHPIAMDGLFSLTDASLTVVEVAKYYQDNIVYQDNLLNIIEI